MKGHSLSEKKPADLIGSWHGLRVEGAASPRPVGEVILPGFLELGGEYSGRHHLTVDTPTS